MFKQMLWHPWTLTADLFTVSQAESRGMEQMMLFHTVSFSWQLLRACGMKPQMFLFRSDCILIALFLWSCWENHFYFTLCQPLKSCSTAEESEEYHLNANLGLQIQCFTNIYCNTYSTIFPPSIHYYFLLKNKVTILENWQWWCSICKLT